jgi:thiosulfate/3-mercaptopyruvate sulfurtransferase
MRSNLVSTDWLANNLSRSDVVVLDASWYTPDRDRDPVAEYRAAHIPGAVRFDIDAISDHSSSLPHTLASPETFAAAVGKLGVSDDMTVVVYDGAGMFSAARVWWNFRVMGLKDVFVLDGGFPKWQAEGRPTEAGEVTRGPRHFSTRFDAGAVAHIDDVRQALDDGLAQVVDARSGTRYRGEEEEPRPGVQPGHMPGSHNVHYSSVLTDGQLKDAKALEEVFSKNGVDLDGPILTTCGSGVTAAILALAVEESGRPLPRLYDGSWAEWGSRSDTPKAKG